VTVTKLSAWIPVTDEAIVDYGIGTPGQQAAAARRLGLHQARARARWLGLPLRVKLWRMLKARRWLGL
jgi:hypothetical protein